MKLWSIALYGDDDDVNLQLGVKQVLPTKAPWNPLSMASDNQTYYWKLSQESDNYMQAGFAGARSSKVSLPRLTKNDPHSVKLS